MIPRYDRAFLFFRAGVGCEGRIVHEQPGQEIGLHPGEAAQEPGLRDARQSRRADPEGPFLEKYRHFSTPKKVNAIPPSFLSLWAGWSGDRGRSSQGDGEAEAVPREPPHSDDPLQTHQVTDLGPVEKYLSHSLRAVN